MSLISLEGLKKTVEKISEKLDQRHMANAAATNSVAGYHKIAQIVTKAANNNYPITFALSVRGMNMPTYISMVLATTASDSTLSSFVYWGNPNAVYLAKAAASTWDLYVKLPAWSRAHVLDCKNSLAGNRSKITYTDEIVTSLPDGAVQAEFKMTASNGLNYRGDINSASDLQTLLESTEWERNDYWVIKSRIADNSYYQNSPALHIGDIFFANQARPSTNLWGSSDVHNYLTLIPNWAFR